MSVFREFDNLRSTVNQLLGDFDTGLRGTSGGRRRGRGRGLGGVDLGGSLFDESDFGFGGMGGFGGFGDEFGTFGLEPTIGFGQGLGWGGQGWGGQGQLQGGWGGQGQGLGQQQLKGAEETKMEETAGGKEQGGVGTTQITTQQPQAGTVQRTFQPMQTLRARVNVEDLKDKIVVTAEMPGFDKSNIKVNVSDDGLLSIRGDQSQEYIDQSKDKRYLRAERTFANVQRNLRLPKTVDPSKIAASYENGVLHVNLPKIEQKEAKKTDIAIS